MQRKERCPVLKFSLVLDQDVQKSDTRPRVIACRSPDLHVIARDTPAGLDYVNPEVDVSGNDYSGLGPSGPQKPPVKKAGSEVPRCRTASRHMHPPARLRFAPPRPKIQYCNHTSHAKPCWGGMDPRAVVCVASPPLLVQFRRKGCLVLRSPRALPALPGKAYFPAGMAATKINHFGIFTKVRFGRP